MNELYYIFLGQFLSKDENCFLNYTNKLNGYYLRFGKYTLIANLKVIQLKPNSHMTSLNGLKKIYLICYLMTTV